MEPHSDRLPEPSTRQWVGFWSMIVQQTQNALNDKAAQFFLISLAGAIGAELMGIGVETIAGALIALPFILFAPLAGWLSDRFSKQRVMLGAAIAQLGILALLYLAVRLHNLPLAMVGFFALAVQSAIYSPAKIGMNKELVGSQHLGFAAGIQQMTAIIAILAGQIGAGIIFDRRFQNLGGTPEHAWSAAATSLMWLTLFAVPAIIMAWIIPRTPAQGAERLHKGILVQHFRHLQDLWRDKPLRHGSFGVAFFWGFAALINIWSIKVAKDLTNGGEGFGTLQAGFMIAASLGMAAGFGTASFLLRKRIELGWVPLAGIAMTIASISLSMVDPSPCLKLLDATDLGWTAVVTTILKPSSGGFLLGLALLAYFAALFLAPLNAWMLDRYPADKRGELQAAVNLQDCLAGIIALVFVESLPFILRHTGIPTLTILRLELAITGLFCGLITWFIIRLVPSHLIRVIGLTLLNTFYRIRSVNSHHVPKRGGVLMLPNHVSWADAFFLTAGSPRPVRFVMDASFMKRPAIRWFCHMFNTVPIALDKPREAMRIAAAALKQGDLVCLFPEGQITRTGTLRELKRGFEIIARQAGAPVVPVWLDGAWGSIFSFERGRFFKKIPYRIPYGLGISFAAPIKPRDAGIQSIRHGILEASASAISARTPGWKKHPSIPHQANGYQLGQLAALPRRQAFVSDDAGPTLKAFSNLFKAPILESGSEKATECRHWIGGGNMRRQLSPSPKQASFFFDLSEQAGTALEVPGWTHLPGLLVDGIIVALSIPDVLFPDEPDRCQAGVRAGARGLLLPGFNYEELDGLLHIRGVATEGQVLTLPPGSHIDSEGFVFLP